MIGIIDLATPRDATSMLSLEPIAEDGSDGVWHVHTAPPDSTVRALAVCHALMGRVVNVCFCHPWPDLVRTWSVHAPYHDDRASII